jgi:hypothetical protein
MPLDFNVAEMATRMRRALGVRGRMPLTADETTVGVYQLADLEKAPWRNDGRSFRFFNVITPTAGQFASHAITNAGTRPFVIDELYIFAGTILTIQMGFGQTGLGGVTTKGGITGELRAGTIDGVEQPGAGFPFEKSNEIAVVSYDTAVSTAGALLQIDGSFTMAAGELKSFPNLDVTVQPPKAGNVPGYLVASTVITASLTVFGRARLY